MDDSENSIIGTAEVWIRHATLQNVYSEVLLGSRRERGTDANEVDWVKTGIHKIVFSGDPFIFASPRQ